MCVIYATMASKRITSKDILENKEELEELLKGPNKLVEVLLDKKLPVPRKPK